MNNFIKIFVISLISLLAFATYAEKQIKTPANSPVGLWKTIDDVTQQPKAIIQIWEANNSLYGRILKIYPQPGESHQAVCIACMGDKHNKQIVGMVILESLKRDQETNKWVNGKILDPKNGKVYQSNVQIADNGQKLEVRGYIGLPLFGRSQTWVRVNSLETA